MGNCCQCCSLPPSTKVKIKICFLRSSLSCVEATTNDYPTFSNSVAPSHCDIAFEVFTNVGCTYYDFLFQLRNTLANDKYNIYLKNKLFDNSIRFIRYETCKDGLLKTYSFPFNKDINDITFSWLFHNLSFLDWTQQGYSLIIWFDINEFDTILDHSNNSSLIHLILSNKLRSMINNAHINNNNNGNVLENGNIVGELPNYEDHEIISEIFKNDPTIIENKNICEMDLNDGIYVTEGNISTIVPGQTADAISLATFVF